MARRDLEYADLTRRNSALGDRFIAIRKLFDDMRSHNVQCERCHRAPATKVIGFGTAAEDARPPRMVCRSCAPQIAAEASLDADIKRQRERFARMKTANIH